MNYAQLKKLDEETLKKLREGKGPSDDCLCSILAPPEDVERHPKGIKSSLKRIFTSMTSSKTKRRFIGRNSVDVPLTFTQGGNGYKEAVKRKKPCGKCGCDNENIVMKHNIANIRIISPDVSSICPCPSDCLPAEKAQMANNIKVTIERVSIRDGDITDSEFSVYCSDDEYDVREPDMERRNGGNLVFDSHNPQPVDRCQPDIDYQA